MLIDFGKSGWVNKARSQPEKENGIRKGETDGNTIDAVFKVRLAIALGYCNVGIVQDSGGTLKLVLGLFRMVIMLK